MQRFRRKNSLQKFASAHARGHNHFNLDRHLTGRQNYKTRGLPTLAEWLDALRWEGKFCQVETSSH